MGNIRERFKNAEIHNGVLPWIIFSLISLGFVGFLVLIVFTIFRINLFLENGFSEPLSYVGGAIAGIGIFMGILQFWLGVQIPKTISTLFIMFGIALFILGAEDNLFFIIGTFSILFIAMGILIIVIWDNNYLMDFEGFEPEKPPIKILLTLNLISFIVGILILLITGGKVLSDPKDQKDTSNSSYNITLNLTCRNENANKVIIPDIHLDEMSGMLQKPEALTISSQSS